MWKMGECTVALKESKYRFFSPFWISYCKGNLPLSRNSDFLTDKNFRVPVTTCKKKKYEDVNEEN